MHLCPYVLSSTIILLFAENESVNQRSSRDFWSSRMGSLMTPLKIVVWTLSIVLCMQWSGVHAVEFSTEVGRKLIQQRVEIETALPGSHSHDTENTNYFRFCSKVAVMAVPGVFILGCIFLCPCFQPKRKEDISAVSHKGLTSVDLSSSFEGNPNLEKIPGCPWRHPPPSPSAFRHPPPSPSVLRHPPPSPSRYAMPPRLNRFRSVNLNFSQIAKATHSFSSSFKIGEGGFGTVYKAQLPGGQWIAVKRARKENFDSAEFNSEVEILSKIEHRNLVKLLGCVDKGKERLIVTEYVSNGTLREHLDGHWGKILDFNQRLEIAIDVSHGLTYLHLYGERQIIHRDVKSSNILLTEGFRAKVADFGFARVTPGDTDQTHVSTKVKGTIGYLDPDYMKTYQLTPKSDVYSFGILLIEILTGRRPVEPKRPSQEKVTLKWAIYSYNKGNIPSLVDPLMNESVDVGILNKILCLAFQCAAPGRSDRPDMKEVGEQLWAIRMEYQSTRKGRI